MEIDYDVIKRAYSFTLSIDGEVHGVTSGDMGYEATGIIFDDISLRIWKLGAEAFNKERKEAEERKRNEFNK